MVVPTLAFSLALNTEHDEPSQVPTMNPSTCVASGSSDLTDAVIDPAAARVKLWVAAPFFVIEPVKSSVISVGAGGVGVVGVDASSQPAAAATTSMTASVFSARR